MVDYLNIPQLQSYIEYPAGDIPEIEFRESLFGLKGSYAYDGECWVLLCEGVMRRQLTLFEILGNKTNVVLQFINFVDPKARKHTDFLNAIKEIDTSDAFARELTHYRGNAFRPSIFITTNRSLVDGHFYTTTIEEPNVMVFMSYEINSIPEDWAIEKELYKDGYWVPNTLYKDYINGKYLPDAQLNEAEKTVIKQAIKDGDFKYRNIKFGFDFDNDGLWLMIDDNDYTGPLVDLFLAGKHYFVRGNDLSKLLKKLRD